MVRVIYNSLCDTYRFPLFISLETQIKTLENPEKIYSEIHDISADEEYDHVEQATEDYPDCSIDVSTSNEQHQTMAPDILFNCKLLI